MDCGTLKRYIAAQVHDPRMEAISESLYEQFIGDSYDDLKSSGWVLPIEEDESITLVANTYEYDVPASFAWIWRIFMADTDGEYSIPIPDHQWRLGYNDGVPTIYFNPTYWGPTPSRKLKIIGQKRPTKPTDDSTTIEDGMIGYIREAAVSKAIGYLSMVPVEGDDPELLAKRVAVINQRIAVANLKAQNAERFLARHPAEFRVRAGSRHVLTR